MKILVSEIIIFILGVIAGIYLYGKSNNITFLKSFRIKIKKVIK